MRSMSARRPATAAAAVDADAAAVGPSSVRRKLPVGFVHETETGDEPSVGTDSDFLRRASSSAALLKHAEDTVQTRCIVAYLFQP